MITVIRISLPSRISLVVISLLCCYVTYSQAQNSEVEVQTARQAAIAAYESGVLTFPQATSIEPEITSGTNWQKAARLDLEAEGYVVRSLSDPEYQNVKAKYAPRLARSLPDIRLAWRDIDDKDAPDAWRCIVIETVPTLLADPSVSVTGLVSELQPLIRNDSSLGVRSAAIVTSEALVLQDKSGTHLSSAADTVVASIVVAATATLQSSGNSMRTLTPEESAMLSLSFQSLLRLIRHADVDENEYRGSIEAWGEDYRRFDYNACLNYIRLLKSGVGVEPASDLYDYAKRVACSKSESSRIDFIRNVNLDTDE